MGLTKYEEAMMAWLKALDIDPKDKIVIEGMKECKSLLTGAPADAPMVSPFADKHLWDKIFKNETTREFMRDPAYRDKVMDIQKDAKKLKEHITDQRIMLTLGVLLDVDMDNPSPGEGGATAGEATDADDVMGKPEEPAFDLTDLEDPAPEPEPEPEPE